MIQRDVRILYMCYWYFPSSSNFVTVSNIVQNVFKKEVLQLARVENFFYIIYYDVIKITTFSPPPITVFFFIFWYVFIYYFLYIYFFTVKICPYIIGFIVPNNFCPRHFPLAVLKYCSPLPSPNIAIPRQPTKNCDLGATRFKTRQDCILALKYHVLFRPKQKKCFGYDFHVLKLKLRFFFITFVIALDFLP